MYSEVTRSSPRNWSMSIPTNIVASQPWRRSLTRLNANRSTRNVASQSGITDRQRKIQALQNERLWMRQKHSSQPGSNRRQQDDKFWAGVGTALTIALLWFGRYNMLQNVSTILVVAFTFVTIGNVVSLQFTEQWSISLDQFLHGLSAQLPERVPGEAYPLITASSGIWDHRSRCHRVDYLSLTGAWRRDTRSGPGKRTDDEAWTRRAKGWMRVMLCDALLSMLIYTVATIAFYMMGVAVLFNEGRDPDGIRMVSTLASAYVPVFGEYAGWLFSRWRDCCPVFNVSCGKCWQRQNVHRRLQSVRIDRKRQSGFA